MDGKHSSPTLVLFHFRAITSVTHSPVKLQSIKIRNISILKKYGVKHMQGPYLPVQGGKSPYIELSPETVADGEKWVPPCMDPADARLSQHLLINTSGAQRTYMGHF